MQYLKKGKSGVQTNTQNSAYYLQARDFQVNAKTDLVGSMSLSQSHLLLLKSPFVFYALCRNTVVLTMGLTHAM